MLGHIRNIVEIHVQRAQNENKLDKRTCACEQAGFYTEAHKLGYETTCLFEGCHRSAAIELRQMMSPEFQAGIHGATHNCDNRSSDKKITDCTPNEPNLAWDMVRVEDDLKVTYGYLGRQRV